MSIQDATKVPCIMPFLFITDDGFYGYRSEGIAIHDVHARSRGSSAGAYFFVSVLSYRRRSAFCRQSDNVISNASEFPCFYRTNLSLSYNGVVSQEAQVRDAEAAAPPCA